MSVDTLFTSLKITSSGYRVVKSGTIITYEENGDIEFNFNDFTLKIRFEKDETQKPSIKAETRPSNEIVLVCYNYDNPLGSGISKPIHIATLNDKKIYFKFVCGNMSNLSCMNYAFYSEV